MNIELTHGQTYKVNGKNLYFIIGHDSFLDLKVDDTQGSYRITDIKVKGNVTTIKKFSNYVSVINLKITKLDNGFFKGRQVTDKNYHPKTTHTNYYTQKGNMIKVTDRLGYVEPDYNGYRSIFNAIQKGDYSVYETE